MVTGFRVWGVDKTYGCRHLASLLSSLMLYLRSEDETAARTASSVSLPELPVGVSALRGRVRTAMESLSMSSSY